MIRNVIHIISVIMLFSMASLLVTNRLSRESIFVSETDHHRSTDQIANFTVSVPDDWEIKESILGTDLIALAPKNGEEDLFRENINIVSTTMDAPISPVQFYALNIKSLDKLLTEFDLEDVKNITINKVPAQRIIFTHRIGPVNLRVMQYLILVGSQAYVMTFTSDILDYKISMPIFKEIANTLAFTKE